MTNILFPVGRMVQGNLYKGSDKDDKGQPRVVKSGPNKGTPFTQFYFAVAIPKQPGHTHWSQTEWGAKVYAVGAQAFPNFYQNPAMAWKIEDGDSTVPNKKNKRPCEQPGFPGHWIVKFSGGYAPRLYQRDATGQYQQMVQPDAVKNGYYIQVNGSVAGNNSTESPGVYMNFDMVLFVGYGEEIVVGPDAASVFGGAAPALPPGASAVPVGVTSMPAAAPPTPTPVAPNPAFLAPPPAAVQVPVPAPLPVPPVPVAARTMTAKAGGATYEQMVAAGWTDDTLRAHGYMA